MTTKQLREELIHWLDTTSEWTFYRRGKSGLLYLHKKKTARIWLFIRFDRAEIRWRDYGQEYHETILLEEHVPVSHIVGFIRAGAAKRLYILFNRSLEVARKRVAECKQELEAAEAEYCRIKELMK